ncbi:MAG TPA: Nif11-like leader peptide family RiPP precursor [Thermoanaerobaculia bacterium]|nr:Nif11-like leader peptide family RiPP precursor [Thermoanaerobaculia bacterium]
MSWERPRSREPPPLSQPREASLSKDLALQFLREAEKDPRLRPQLDAIDPAQSAQLLQALTRIARDAGYELSAQDLRDAMAEWAGEMLDDSELSRISGGSSDPSA